MAELAVNAALAVIGAVQIASPLLNKVQPDKDVENHVRTMGNWLSTMKAFIKDNDGDEGRSSMVDDKVKKARNIAYDIEDVLDQMLLHNPPYSFHSHRINQEVHNMFHQVVHGFPLREISKRIEKIMNDIKTFKSVRQDAFPNQGAPSTRMGGQPLVSRLLRDDEMVGYEEQKREFLHQLLNGEEGLVKLAVDGRGGSGKTTFVKNIFWKGNILAEFDCHAWVHVSQKPDMEKILDNLLKQLCSSRSEQYPADDGSPTETKLRNYLEGMRYIIVLDDVWSERDWDNIANALSGSFRGSRLIVTTRYSNLAAKFASSSRQIHTLNGLEWQQVWTLFCRKAFEREDGECTAELKDCAVRIAVRCDRLPLAIVTVGDALSNSRLPNDWESFHKNLASEIRRGRSQLSAITTSILTSYMDLSTNLKCCFLYFSIFPENYSVKRGRLVRLWVAERFAMETDLKTAEEVAEEYLNELIQRNLVHVFRWDFDGRPRNCGVSYLDLMFIIQKCKDENFASNFPGQNESQIRRLSLQINGCTPPAQLGSVRSLFLLRSSDVEVLQKLELVKVLDLQGAPLTKFPTIITRFILLRYLNFRDSKIKKIPTGIKKLSYLETLDLRQTDVTVLPQETSHLHKLCHLLVYNDTNDKCVAFHSVQGVKVYGEIGNLTNLQNLSLVNVGKKGKILKELKKLTKLRKLGLTGLRMEHGRDLSAALASMELLTSLHLCSNTKEECIELHNMEKPPQKLERLYLKGGLTEFPEWISSLDNLLQIHLNCSKMLFNPLRALGHLPNLTELHLVDCNIGEELMFKTSYFKKLKSLTIEELTNLRSVTISDTALPDLEQMSLGKCPKMEILRIGLTKIKELSLYGLPSEFIYEPPQGENIPAVHFPSS